MNRPIDILLALAAIASPAIAAPVSAAASVPDWSAAPVIGERAAGPGSVVRPAGLPAPPAPPTARPDPGPRRAASTSRIDRAPQDTTRGIEAVMRGIAFSLLATLALVAMLILLRRLFPTLYDHLHVWGRTRTRPIEVGRIGQVSADRVMALLLRTAKTIRLAVTLLLLYLYAVVVLSFFPKLRDVAANLFGYVTDPVGRLITLLAGSLSNFFYIALIAIAARYILKIIRLVFDELAAETITLRGFYAEWADPTYKIIRVIVLAFTAIAIWPFVPGSDSPVFQGIAAFLGVLVSLGSVSTIADAIGGIVLIYMRPFQIGDRVKIADTTGDVIWKTLLMTRVRTIKNVDVTIPNTRVLRSHMINYSAEARRRGLILHTNIAIGYDAPWPMVHEALIAAADATRDVLDEPPPFVLQRSLDPFSVRYELNAYINQPNRMEEIYSDLHRNVQDQCARSGIEIVVPNYSAIRDGNRTTIPDGYLPDSYEPPAFHVVRGPEPQREEG